MDEVILPDGEEYKSIEVLQKVTRGGMGGSSSFCFQGANSLCACRVVP